MESRLPIALPTHDAFQKTSFYLCTSAGSIGLAYINLVLVGIHGIFPAIAIWVLFNYLMHNDKLWTCLWTKGYYNQAHRHKDYIAISNIITFGLLVATTIVMSPAMGTASSLLFSAAILDFGLISNSTVRRYAERRSGRNPGDDSVSGALRYAILAENNSKRMMLMNTIGLSLGLVGIVSMGIFGVKDIMTVPYVQFMTILAREGAIFVAFEVCFAVILAYSISVIWDTDRYGTRMSHETLMQCTNILGGEGMF